MTWRKAFLDKKYKARDGGLAACRIAKRFFKCKTYAAVEGRGGACTP